MLEDDEAYWATLLTASDPPAPDSAELAEHTTGEELDRVRAAVRARQRAGECLRDPRLPWPPCGMRWRWQGDDGEGGLFDWAGPPVEDCAASW